MQSLSLFSGVGGLDIAMEQHGFEPAAFVEIDPFCRSVLARRWPGVPQHDDVRAVAGADYAGIDLIVGGFPCFVAGTLIETRRGMLPIERVVEGDEVLTHRQRWRKVTSTMSREATATREVKALGLRTTTTDEHPYWARRKGRIWNNDRREYDRTFAAPRWVEAAQLTKDDYIALIATTHGEGDAPTPATANVIGRWLADGWVTDYPRVDRKSGRAQHVVISVGKHREDALIAALADAGLTATRSEERTATKFIITSGPLFRLVAPFGRGAGGKRLPVEVFSWPADQRLALLQGWLVDGGVTISRELAFGMVRLARTLGMQPQLGLAKVTPTAVIEGRTVNQRPWWRVRFSEATREPFFDDGVLWSPVRTTKAAGPATVYNLSVDEDESYIADGAIVHNCQPVSYAGRGLAQDDERWLWPEFARLIEEAQPRYVLAENVPGLRHRGLQIVLADLVRLGYGGVFGIVSAAEVGAWHLRNRMWIRAERGGVEFIEAISGLTSALIDEDALGPTPTAHPRTHTPRAVDHGRQLANEVSAARWPTPGAQDAKWRATKNASAKRAANGAHQLGLEDAVVLERVVYPTARYADADRGGRGDLLQALRGNANGHFRFPTAHGMGGGRNGRDDGHGSELRQAAATFPTPTTRDHKDAGPNVNFAKIAAKSRLAGVVAMDEATTGEGPLNPAWVEWLMGFPMGWTDLVADTDDLIWWTWAAEPPIPRLAKSIPDRVHRLKAMGNAVVPQTGSEAWRRLSSDFTAQLTLRF